MSEPLRVVFDPNVLVSAAIAGGAPRRLVDLATAGTIVMISCPQLQREFETVLARDNFVRWRSREGLDRFVAGIRRLAHPADDPTNISKVTRDPNDDYLIALYHSTEADILCSGDHDLHAVKGIEVLTPRDLLDRITAPPSAGQS